MQVRDLETSLQEAALEAVHDALFARAASMGGARASPLVQSQLLPLLTALSTGGAASAACIGKACAALKAKKRLRGSAVAAGMQAVLAAGLSTLSQSGSNALLADCKLDYRSPHHIQSAADICICSRERSACELCTGVCGLRQRQRTC